MSREVVFEAGVLIIGDGGVTELMMTVGNTPSEGDGSHRPFARELRRKLINRGATGVDTPHWAAGVVRFVGAP